MQMCAIYTLGALDTICALFTQLKSLKVNPILLVAKLKN